jgi:hypothetical protein
MPLSGTADLEPATTGSIGGYLNTRLVVTAS